MTEAVKRSDTQSATILYSGGRYDSVPGETVLDTLLRQKVDLAYSCKKGTCLSCILKTDSPVPAEAQEGLRPTLASQGYFLPCICPPADGMIIEPASAGELFVKAEVADIEKLAPHITRVRLKTAEPFEYRAGQFINLRRADGLTRCYSLASLPEQDETLELHIKQLENGLMSNWVAEAAGAGEAVEVQGPNGTCFYLDGNQDAPLLMIGNGAGLAPLWAIARDALSRGHRGNIHLYHGSRHEDGLYLRDELTALADRNRNFRYHACLSGALVPNSCRRGRAEQVAFEDHQDIAGWRFYLCGYPQMVDAARKKAFLKGASLSDILSDAFELRELRKKPRN